MAPSKLIGSRILFAWIFVATSAAFTTPSTSTVPSTPQTKDNVQSSDFWGQVRSRDEVETHVKARLAYVASRLPTPTADTDPNETNNSELLELEQVQVLSADPPLVAIHNFITSEMCNAIINAAKSNENWKQSTTGADQKKTEDRTSTTVWLKDQECQDPLRLIAEKVSAITGLAPTNMENLQVVKYNEGQAFNLHTDHQNSFNELAVRGRLATCLVYLCEPDGGGETWFPGIPTPDTDSGGSGGTASSDDVDDAVKVAPRTGSAVFFWNSLERPGCTDYDPEMFLNVDIRLRHAGLPTIGTGEKWICNRWVHPISFGAGVRGIEPREL